VIGSQLTSLVLRVDGGAPIPVSNVIPGLPRNGPTSVTYNVDTPVLGPGSHQLCVSANGSDGGGPGSVTDCHTVLINAPPVVDPGGPYAGQEGTPIGIAGTVTDPDGPSLTTAWTVTPGSGVDPGAACTFGNAAAPVTTITCTDDGAFTLRLTADDGVNPPVSATATLTVANVAPVVSISAPANGSLFTRGTPVTFTAPFTDAGRNDSHTCTVDFDDGTPVASGTVTETPNSGAGSCATSHAFTALGPHNVLVTVRDDDGGAGTAVVRVVIFVPAEAWAISAGGPVTIAKTPHAVCPPDADLTSVGLNVPGVANVNALNASCSVNPDTGVTHADASVDGASLLGGAITITNIETSCVAGPAGLSGSSRVGTINGTPIGAGSGQLTIPLLATVFYNQTVTTPDGQLFQYAIRIRTLLGQEIILSGCRVG
jgi:trimeric autotransporter adhesin